MKTLNQIVKALNDFADNHAQINSFQQANFSEITTSKSQIYPLMFCELGECTASESILEMTFTILFGDQESHDKRNRLEIQSDMLSVCNDLYSYLLTEEIFDDIDLTVLDNVKMKPFSMKFNNQISGYYIIFTLKINRDNCDIPMDLRIVEDEDPCAGLVLATEGFAIEGKEHGCGGVQQYEITGGGSQYNADSFTWHVVNGTINSANGLDAINILWDNDVITGQTYCVANYECGASVQSETITLSLIPPIPIISPTTLCAGGSQIYTVSNYTNTTSYQWTVTGDNFSMNIDPTLNSQFYVEWGAGGGTLSVTATNACGNSASSTQLTTNC